MLTFKPGVDEHDVSTQMWYALGVAAALHWKMFDRGMVVTAMRDGQHMIGSLHYKGQAADVRTNDMSPIMAQSWAAQCRALLYSFGFDVVLETTPPHMHIEFDPRDARVFPVPPQAVTMSPTPAVTA